MNGGVVMSSSIMLIGLDNGNKCTKTMWGLYVSQDLQNLMLSRLQRAIYCLQR